MKLGSSARHGEPIKKKTWRAGMVSARAWPEHSVLMCDAFISEAGIVGDSCGGRPAKLCEYFFRLGWKDLSASETSRNTRYDLEIIADSARRVGCTATQDHPPL